MKTIALRHCAYETLAAAVQLEDESAWFALAAREGETWVCHRLQPVADRDYAIRRPDQLSIGSRAWVPLARVAAERGLDLLFVHTHPGGYRAFSTADDIAEAALHKDLSLIAPGVQLVAAVVTPQADGLGFAARHGIDPVDRVRFAGRQLRILTSGDASRLPDPSFDRQIRAFGPSGQKVLADLRAAVVGVGGTGSAAAQQLLRLGIGKLIVIDPDISTEPTLTRGWGTRKEDLGHPKVSVITRLGHEIGFRTAVASATGTVTDLHIAQQLRDVDVIFGCTDDHAGRLVLNRLAYWCNIPLVDMGVLITNPDQPRIETRITYIAPDTACLLCRGRVDPSIARAERLDPIERERLRSEGYVPDIDTPQPAVIAYTTTTAGLAVTELLNRLFGLTDPQATESLLTLEDARWSTNDRTPRPGCWCTTNEVQAREPFLGLQW